MAKGGNYERELSRELSLWCSNGEDDDLFWRSASSGAKATQRAKKGKKTKGHCGDICSTDPSSAFVTRVITIEAKRGYNDKNLANLVDKPTRGQSANIDVFVEQAILAARRADTPYWLLIHRRDGCKAMAYVPDRLVKAIKARGGMKQACIPYAWCTCVDLSGPIHAMRFVDFLKRTPPSVIRRIAEEL